MEDSAMASNLPFFPAIAEFFTAAQGRFNPAIRNHRDAVDSGFSMAIELTSFSLQLSFSLLSSSRPFSLLPYRNHLLSQSKPFGILTFIIQWCQTISNKNISTLYLSSKLLEILHKFFALSVLVRHLICNMLKYKSILFRCENQCRINHKVRNWSYKWIIMHL